MDEFTKATWHLLDQPSQAWLKRPALVWKSKLAGQDANNEQHQVAHEGPVPGGSIFQHQLLQKATALIVTDRSSAGYINP